MPILQATNIVSNAQPTCNNRLPEICSWAADPLVRAASIPKVPYEIVILSGASAKRSAVLAQSKRLP